MHSFRVVLLPLFVFAAACQDDGNLSGVRPDMVLTPPAGTPLVFEDVVLGRAEGEPMVVTAENRGDFDLVLAAVRLDGPNAGDFVVTSAPERVAPGNTGEIFVRFAPSVPGERAATLVIDSNDADLPTASFPLAGTAREACRLSMEPRHLIFALDDVQEVSVTAETTTDCAVEQILLDRTLFAILEEPALPWLIPAGQTETLMIQHTAISRQPGIPTRELRLRESEGTEAVMTLEGEAPLSGCLTITPEERVLFPTTPAGQISYEDVVVTNRCEQMARVLSANIGTGPSFSVSTTGFPLEVPPLGALSITLEYEGFSELGDRGVLNLDTNDATVARVSLELFGQASKPQVQVFPSAVDFGGVVVRNLQGTPPRSECSSAVRFAQIYSVGDAEIVVERLEIDPAGDEHFEITNVLVDEEPVRDLDQPFTIPPNKEGRITLKFNPTTTATAVHRSTLVVHHNAEGSPSRVTLRGEGREDITYTDSFTQLDGPRIDVLFVVQNTPLSEDEQSKLVEQVEGFITTAEAANADYHMAVTVTDGRSPNAGKLERCFPHPTIVSPAYADQATRIEALECMLEVGSNGGFFFVSGLGAALAALERALDPDNQDPMVNPSAGFIRPDAKLMVVVLTTRDDDSVESNALLRDYLLSVKGPHRPDRVVVHAIAGPVLGPCPNQPQFFVRPGYRYFWMTEATNGVFFNVCEEDWTPFFQQIGLDVFQPIDEWDLTGEPEPSTLQITVDGTAVPPDPTNGYTYRATSNSVIFHGSALPAPGTDVTISYQGACRP